MRVAFDWFFAERRQTALDQRAQGLIIERQLAQDARGWRRRFALHEDSKQFGLARRTAPQLLELSPVDLPRSRDEQLSLPSNFGFTNHLRQDAAHDRFQRAAVISAHPFRELE